MAGWRGASASVMDASGVSVVVADSGGALEVPLLLDRDDWSVFDLRDWLIRFIVCSATVLPLCWRVNAHCIPPWGCSDTLGHTRLFLNVSTKVATDLGLVISLSFREASKQI